MAVYDLWKGRDGKPTARHGRGLRYRVAVKGWPTTHCRTKSEADRLNALRITTGPPTAPSTMTVGDGIDAWLRTKTGLKSEDHFRRTATAVRARWGSVPATAVTWTDVQDWLDNATSIDREATRPGAPMSTHPASASTRIKRLQCLRGALEHAVRAGAIPADPTAGVVRVPRTSRREPRFLTAAQLAELAAHAKQPEVIWLMGTTGVRSGEAAALNVGDVVTRRGGTRLRVRQAKNGHPRDVPITRQVLDMLDLDRPADEPLLTAPGGGRLQMRNWRARDFDQAVTAAGMEGLRPHDLRHTAVSLAIASGADIKVVQRFAGHRTAAMTLDVYGHLMDDSLDDVGARIAAALTQNVPGETG